MPRSLQPGEDAGECGTAADDWRGRDPAGVIFWGPAFCAGRAPRSPVLCWEHCVPRLDGPDPQDDPLLWTSHLMAISLLAWSHQTCIFQLRRQTEALIRAAASLPSFQHKCGARSALKTS